MSIRAARLANAGRQSGRGGAVGGWRGGRRHAVAELPHRHPSAGRQREDACRSRQDRRATSTSRWPCRRKIRRAKSPTIAGRNPLTGAKVENLSPAAATELQMDVMAKGVAVVTANAGIAAQLGFQPGDIVRSVNGAAINRVGDLVRGAERRQSLGHGGGARRPASCNSPSRMIVLICDDCALRVPKCAKYFLRLLPAINSCSI